MLRTWRRSKEIAALDQVPEVAVDHRHEQLAGEYGLTPARTHLSGVVPPRPAPQRSGDAPVSRPATHRAADGLETDYVTREALSDRRTTLVTLTTAYRGDDADEEESEEFARLLFEDLTDRQIASLTRGLSHVLDRLARHTTRRR
jgi:hypothetical protein